MGIDIVLTIIPALEGHPISLTSTTIQPSFTIDLDFLINMTGFPKSEHNHIKPARNLPTTSAFPPLDYPVIVNI